MEKPPLPDGYDWVVRWDRASGEVYINIVRRDGGVELRGTLSLPGEYIVREDEFDRIVSRAMNNLAVQFRDRLDWEEWLRKWQ